MQSPFLNRWKQVAEKAGIQATAFMKDSSSKLAAESRGMAQSFSLPGESEKCAKILESFLGQHLYPYHIYQNCDSMIYRWFGFFS